MKIKKRVKGLILKRDNAVNAWTDNCFCFDMYCYDADKPPGIDDYDDDIELLCYEYPELILESFGPKSIDCRNDDFYYSQKRENEELDYWIDCIDKQKRGDS